MALSQHMPLERINEQARQLDPARALLTLLAAPLFVLGWLAAKVVTGLWVVFVWSAAAIRVGWQEGRTPSVKAEGG